MDLISSHPRKAVGRPRKPLLIGQRVYTETMYAHSFKTQLDIAARIKVSLPRVQRYLVEIGLHTPPIHDSTAHRVTVRAAIRLYREGMPVKDVLESTGLVVSELYKALRNAGIPLRTFGGQGRKRKQAQTTLE